ncbi:MAG: hypothetical protein EPN21_15015 [Methylococcaceae bacterium]|nr:MAG: hypothetical protein EPN21_15015 [Methylococcaceae bacterium]
MSKHPHLTPISTIALLSAVLAGCAAQPAATPLPATDTLAQNDFPTLARVEYVMQCMQKKGGQNFNNLYACTCGIDKLAEKMRYDAYVEAQTFANMGGLTGDRGGSVRDAPQSRNLKKELQAALAYAQDSCTVAKPGAEN